MTTTNLVFAAFFGMWTTLISDNVSYILFVTFSVFLWCNLVDLVFSKMRNKDES